MGFPAHGFGLPWVLQNRGACLPFAFAALTWLSGVAAAQAPVLDGAIDDVIVYAQTEADRGVVESDPAQDICKSNLLLIPCSAPQVACLTGGGTYFVNGFDLLLGVAAYDAAAENLYLGIRAAGVIGDSDGDGTENGGIGCTPSLSPGEHRIADAAQIGFQEFYEWRLDTNCDGSPELVVRVQGEEISVTGATVAEKAFSRMGTEIEAHVRGIAFSPGWRMQIFAGSTTDGLEDDTGGFTALTPDPFLEVAAPEAVHDQPFLGVPADFTGDGLLDFALAVNGGAQLLKAVTGTSYDSLSSIPTGGTGRGIAAGNFNDDAALDLAITTTTGLHVAIGQEVDGAPNGEFEIVETYDVGPNPQDIEVADFNEDGVLDLAVAATGLNAVAVLLGNALGNGVSDATFGSPIFYPVGSLPLFMVQGDFNEDGVADLAATNFSGTSNSVSVLLGHSASPRRGDGTFEAAFEVATVGTPIAIAAGDFNEDGASDLAVGSNNGAGIGIHLGNQSGGMGDGTFGAPSSYPLPGESCRAVATGDFNQDGRTDLVVAMGTSGLVRFLFGNGTGEKGDGTFTVGQSMDVGGFITGVAVENFDGLGATDAMLTRLDLDDVVPAQGACPSLSPDLLALHEFAHPGPYLHGSNLLVEWDRGPDTQEVNVEFSADGVGWETVATRVTDPYLWWTVPPISTVSARLRAVDAWNYLVADTTDVPFELTGSPIGVPEVRTGPISFSPPRPNPSRGPVAFELMLDRPLVVAVGLYDVAGRRVREVWNGSIEEGRHLITWDGRDEQSRLVPPGLYWVRAIVSGETLPRVHQILRLPE